MSSVIVNGCNSRRFALRIFRWLILRRGSQSAKATIEWSRNGEGWRAVCASQRETPTCRHRELVSPIFFIQLGLHSLLVLSRGCQPALLSTLSLYFHSRRKSLRSDVDFIVCDVRNNNLRGTTSEFNISGFT